MQWRMKFLSPDNLKALGSDNIGAVVMINERPNLVIEESQETQRDGTIIRKTTGKSYWKPFAYRASKDHHLLGNISENAELSLYMDGKVAEQWKMQVCMHGVMIPGEESMASFMITDANMYFPKYNTKEYDEDSQ